jgi:hypothetical protein
MLMPMARSRYTLLATDVNSAESPAGRSCRAPDSSQAAAAELTMARCSESSMLQLKPDGSLGPEDGGLCVTHHSEGRLSLGPSAGAAAPCAKFRSHPDGSLRAEGSAELCLSSTAAAAAAGAGAGGSLSLRRCTPTLDGQGWTTTDSMTGAYIEQVNKSAVFSPAAGDRQTGFPDAGQLLLQGSKHGVAIVADQAQTSLDIKFVPPAAWTEANCSLSADGTVCSSGHFSGGPIGKMYPTCRWNASVKGDSVVLDAWQG